MKYALWLLIGTCCLFASCRKDLLHWKETVPVAAARPGERLNKIYFADTVNGFIVGGIRYEDASMLITRDGGKSWERQHFPEAGKTLLGINASPSGTIYTVGLDGRMLFSEDMGRHWQFRQLPYQQYKDIAWPEAGQGILISGISFHEGRITHMQKDGTILSEQFFDFELNKLLFVHPDTGFITGHGVLMKTSDRGNTWETLPVKNDNFTGITAVGTSQIWVCGYNGSIFHSNNGGRNWRVLRNGNNFNLPRYKLYDLHFIDAEKGFAVGEEGLVIYTDDGGKHWMEYNRFTSNALRDIHPLNNGMLLVCGDNGSVFQIQP